MKNLASVEVVAVAQHGREALGIMEATRPNLLLLDIQMPGIDGFDLLERMPPSLTPAVVFVTAFDRYALKAFAVRAVDYVLKPVVQQRLEAALEQARRDIASRNGREKARRAAATDRGAAPAVAGAASPVTTRNCGFTSGPRWSGSRSAEIDWIEAQKDYVRIHSGSRSYFSRGLIGTLEDRLDPAEFMRVHRSAIVRLDRIRAVSRGRYGVLDVDLITGARVRVGRKYSAGVRTRLGERAAKRPDMPCTACSSPSARPRPFATG